jgi:FKBP12-rapamycin complex-associated protein
MGIIGDVPMLPSKISSDYAREMLYSVIWSTEEKAARNNRQVDLTAKQESWLAKLGSWSEALAVYQEKLRSDPSDFEALLGCMRCLDASGEWRKVLELFQQNLSTMSTPSSLGNIQLRADIAPRSRRKAIRMCAHAAWRLGQWGDLEKFSAELVRGPTVPTLTTPALSDQLVDNPLSAVDFDAAFYSSVLHIHRNEWAEAANAIDAARQAMDGRLTALMAESYSRAYPSMVTAQSLAEMEEIIELRKVGERFKTSAHQHPANRPNEDSARQRLLSVWRERLNGTFARVCIVSLSI